MPDRSLALGRRPFLVCALAALLAPSAAAAQTPARGARIGVLASTTGETLTAGLDAFRQALRGAGWVEGQNLVIEARYPGDRYEALAELAVALVRLKPDVIFAQGTPAAQAAKRATTMIPIVIETLGDAVSSGLVSNLARPGANVTGVSGFAPELSGKRLELVRELVPKADRVALLANRSNPVTVAIVRAAEDAGRQMRIQLEVVDVRVLADLGAAFDAMTRARSDAFIVVPDPLLFSQRRRLVELAARHRLPAVYETRLFPEVGGLLSYGPHPYERFTRAGVYVDRILRGARPGELPVEQPSTFELVLNLQTARSLGLNVSPALRLRADHLIE
jgi:putative tryptophan/tyrosine transport system substrate-binding protein